MKFVKLFIPLFLLLFIVACGNQPTGGQQGAAPPAPSPLPTLHIPANADPTEVAVAIGRATEAAVQAQFAQATAVAIANHATAEARNLTMTAEAVSAQQTAVIEERHYIATLEAQATEGAIRATMVSLQIQETVQAMNGRATADAVAMAGTATAVSQVARVEAEAIAARSTQQAINLQNEATAARRAERMGLFHVVAFWVMLVLVVVAALVLVYLYARQRLAQTIHANGQDIVILPSPDGPRFLPPTFRVIEPERRNPPLLTDGGGAEPEEAGTAVATYQQGMTLPERLPPGQIGLGFSGTKQLWFDFPDLKDCLIVGEKGGGKSNFLCSVALQAQIQGWQVWLADAEQMTFNPDVWGDVAGSVPEVEAMLGAVIQEMDRRLEMYRDAFCYVRQLPQDQVFFVDNLTNYNRAANMFNLEKLPPMLVVWDEANDHIKANANLDAALWRVARQIRKPGGWVFVGGHDWKANQITTEVRNLFGRRIGFRCAAGASQVVLGTKAAAGIDERLPGKGIVSYGRGLAHFRSFYVPAARLLRDARPITIPGEVVRPPAGQGNGRYVETSETVDMTALMDADNLRQAGEQVFRSRRQVALFLRGVDNGEAYVAADEALRVLAGERHQRAQELLANVEFSV